VLVVGTSRHRAKILGRFFQRLRRLSGWLGSLKGLGRPVTNSRRLSLP
jgi:hypothetical protein